MENKKIYFASDFHLGIPNKTESQEREKLIVLWLDTIKNDADSIYLLGDIFDFWFEYKKVIPKGFVRFLGKISELIDNGIKIYFFTGNHDMWMEEYFNEEIGVIVHKKNQIISHQNKQLFIGHGDGIDKTDYSYKLLNIIFKSKICKWLFSRLHPNFAFKIAQAWSRKSRGKIYNDTDINNGIEKLIEYCKKRQSIKAVDYYIFGHQHHPIKRNINQRCLYVNTGDWILHKTYAVLEDGLLELKTFKAE